MGKSNICCASEVCRQPVLIQCATQRHSSSALGPCAIIWEGDKKKGGGEKDPVHEIINECDLFILRFEMSDDTSETCAVMARVCA